MTEEEIFAEAVTKQDPAERAAYLDQACADDANLRTAVEALLAAADHPDSFLDRPAGFLEETLQYTPVAEAPGTAIGPYKLRERIGEGGMGVVFVAEQERPVRRKVALKIIKAGMDTQQVIARFEAERQALAMMDHPNIAKVLDAGSTDSGRPYFVMELVRGVPITEYCDQNKLTIRQRLELFSQVCQAIQHAHQKGIIHRDVKPTNVLVMVHDVRPVPKVIDFGVAKAISQRLTEHTIYTRLNEFIGTPLYMSPEQAGQSGLDIDTRSDIYSLGVLLYELLTGTTPFEKQRLQEAALDEMRRIIREEEPPKPSTKISSLGATATSISEHRQTDPGRLQQLVRGDLDWIVMKALEKDRTRRYETASAFAADVQRFLDDEPIEARPPSALYQMRKFVRRNRTAVCVSASLLILLVAGLLGTTSGWIAVYRTLAQLKEKQAELQQAMIDKALVAAMSGDFAAAEEAIENAKLAGVSAGWQHFLRGLAGFFRCEYKNAAERFAQAVEEEPNLRAAQSMLSVARCYSGDLVEYQLTAVDPPGTSLGEDDRYAVLFQGYATALFNPVGAAQTMTTAIERRPTWVVGRVLLAEALAHAALATGKQEYVAAAFEAIGPAKATLGRCPFVALIDLVVHLAALQIAAEQRQPTESLHSEASRIAAYIEGNFERYMHPVAWFHDWEGDQEGAVRCWAKGVANYPGSADFVRHQYVAFLCRLGKLDDALAEANAGVKPVGPYTEIARALVLAEFSERHSEAVGACQTLVRSGYSLDVRTFALQALMLLGEDQMALVESRRMLDDADELNDTWLCKSVIELVAGRVRADELLQRAGPLRSNLVRAHFALGIERLAAGSRPEAQRHFQACVDSGIFVANQFQWAKAFLARMQHPEWPGWIAKESTGP